MEKYHNSIKEKLYKELSNSALGYLATGMRLFHAERKRPTCIQPIIGNLGIAIELMLKVWIIKNNPALLFKDLPLELKVLFITPKSIPSDFNWRRYDIDLRSFNFK